MRGYFVDRPERDRRAERDAVDHAAPGAIDVDGVAPGPCAPGMARKEPYRDVLAGVPGATPSTAVAPGADDEVRGSRPVSRVLSRTAIPLRCASPRTCSDLPGSSCGLTQRSPIRSCSKWGLPCRRVLPPARCALTAPFHPYLPLPAGGIFSVALSVGSRPPGVTWHPAHGARTFLQGVTPSGCPADSRR